MPDSVATDLEPNRSLSSCWSDTLARTLLSALSECECAEALQSLDVKHSAADAADDPRRALVELARSDSRVRGEIARRWRAARANLVSTAEALHRVIADAATFAKAMLDHFVAEDVLLELITDTHDDGWELADEFVRSVELLALRRELRLVLERLAGDPESPPNRIARIVIFGGHPQDERQLGERLFDASPFDVRWRACEKQGKEIHKTIADALRHADAAIIITSRISHEFMRGVKAFAELYGIPWRVVIKATGNHLAVALKELFPDIAWQPTK